MSAQRNFRRGLAAQFISDFALEHVGKRPTDSELIKFLVKVDRLASMDLKNCNTNQHRQEVYAAVAAAHMTVVKLAGSSGSATRKLCDALTNLALGAQRQTRLKPATGSRQPISQEDDTRAAIIVACERYPERKKEIIAKGAAELGLTTSQVSKFLENYAGELYKRRSLHRNVTFYRNAADAGDTWPFDDLIKKT